MCCLIGKLSLVALKGVLRVQTQTWRKINQFLNRKHARKITSNFCCCGCLDMTNTV